MSNSNFSSFPLGGGTVLAAGVRPSDLPEERRSRSPDKNRLSTMEATPPLGVENDLAQRTVNALLQSDARFHAIFENAAVGIILVSLERRFIALNAVTEKIIGYSFEEIQHIDPRTLAVPEDRSMDHQLFKELVEGNRE